MCCLGPVRKVVLAIEVLVYHCGLEQGNDSRGDEMEEGRVLQIKRSRRLRSHFKEGKDDLGKLGWVVVSRKKRQRMGRRKGRV